MTMLRLTTDDDFDASGEPFRFPLELVQRSNGTQKRSVASSPNGLNELSECDDADRVLHAFDDADRVLHAFDDVSRRMCDLARRLHILGYFDDGDDGPRAA